MKIVIDGPRSKTSRKQLVILAATTKEDETSLRELYELLHKFEKTEILVSLAESTLEGDEVKRISLVVE